MLYSDSIMEMAESFIALEMDLDSATLSDEMKEAVDQIKAGQKCIIDAKKCKIEHKNSEATKLGRQAILHFKQALNFARTIPNDNAAEFVAACYTKKQITALLRKDPRGATRQTVIDLINASMIEARVLLFPLRIG